MFDTVEKLQECVERVEKEFNVVSIDNGFHHPDPDGYPIIRVLVRLPLRSGREFVAQLEIHHAKLYERREEAKDEYAKLRGVFAAASPPEYVDGVLRLVMEHLSSTRAKCRWDAVEGLATAAELEQTRDDAQRMLRELQEHWDKDKQEMNSKKGAQRAAEVRAAQGIAPVAVGGTNAEM